MSLHKNDERIVQPHLTTEYRLIKMEREFSAALSILENRISLLEQKEAERGTNIKTTTD